MDGVIGALFPVINGYSVSNYPPLPPSLPFFPLSLPPFLPSHTMYTFRWLMYIHVHVQHVLFWCMDYMYVNFRQFSISVFGCCWTFPNDYYIILHQSIILQPKTISVLHNTPTIFSVYHYMYNCAQLGVHVPNARVLARWHHYLITGNQLLDWHLNPNRMPFIGWTGLAAKLAMLWTAMCCASSRVCAVTSATNGSPLLVVRVIPMDEAGLIPGRSY